MREQRVDHVWLDARHLGAQFLEQRFPSIVARCRELGFDPATELLPVAPAQHYASGGVETDHLGRSSLDGLYACGECSCTGVHGANRLASNSLLEGLVFAHRIADDVAARLAAGELALREPSGEAGAAAVLDASHRLDVQRAMTRGSGPVRSGASTRAAVDTLAALAALPPTEAEPSPATWETTNLLHLGQALSLVAHRREETRGGHVRSDFPERDDAHWLRHLTTTRSADGSLVITEEPVGAPA
jgi:L-aspartate oxidase